ncbi:hypothetical protein NDU88_006938 [Pleurodeles waltl]|uniref:Uncharacterized protein n=1 Tax=Pleurodeles waltl TaxID=8319 RepID=A0AAV7LS78_PLEWA|nr:hypothetical protein NDU88_006938 [Pleurodeles waltl]
MPIGACRFFLCSQPAPLGQVRARDNLCQAKVGGSVGGAWELTLALLPVPEKQRQREPGCFSRHQHHHQRRQQARAPLCL